jgi:GntR family transcriptional regulator/MocR family aminotransferase
MDMLTFALKADGKTPLYHQLYSFIKTQIQSGRIAVDTKLPSKRKLSSYLKISQNTIQTAYGQLIEEGYVVPVERKGFFVSRIDNLIKLGAPGEFLAPAPEDAAGLYDFSYHGVDLQTFPYTVWRRLYREVVNEYDKELLRLTDSQGLLLLRKEIASYLFQSRGVNCSADQLIISSGTEYLFQILIQLFEKQSVFGIENPGYEKLYQLFAGNRASFRPVGIDGKGMMPDEIGKSGANIVCVTPAHQFPTGEIMPISRRVQILNWSNEKDGRYIIEDDYDSEFKYSGKPVPALQGLDSNDKVIYMGAFSKSLSPAMRVSYMVLPRHLMKRFRENLSYIICPVPVIEQKALSRFIGEGHFERHLNKMRNIYKKKRETLVGAVRDLHQGIEISGAEAGLQLLVNPGNGMRENELVGTALKAGVKVYGISNYYYKKTAPDGPATVLVGYAAMTEAEIKEAVGLLNKAWFQRDDE